MEEMQISEFSINLEVCKYTFVRKRGRVKEWKRRWNDEMHYKHMRCDSMILFQKLKGVYYMNTFSDVDDFANSNVNKAFNVCDNGSTVDRAKAHLFISM